MTYDISKSGGRRCLRCEEVVPGNVTLCPNCGTAISLREIIPAPVSSSHFDQFAPIVVDRTALIKHFQKDSSTVYKIWAPDNALWTEWAKPVLFASPSSHREASLDIPDIDWITAKPDTMVIIDLPGKTGVEEGLALARLGFRPVPLYNGVRGTAMTIIVNVEDITAALYAGVDVLAALNLPHNAPPVFMLDSNRMEGDKKAPGLYDNRWCVFPQDMPSASILSGQGIDRVIVRSDRVRDDLLHVLRRYQEQRIKILQSFGGRATEITVPRPSWFRSLFYRFKVTFGLTRNAAGGFGAMIPEPGRSGRNFGRMG